MNGNCDECRALGRDEGQFECINVDCVSPSEHFTNKFIRN